jgi:hypothetical protein
MPQITFIITPPTSPATLETSPLRILAIRTKLYLRTHHPHTSSVQEMIRREVLVRIPSTQQSSVISMMIDIQPSPSMTVSIEGFAIAQSYVDG